MSCAVNTFDLLRNSMHNVQQEEYASNRRSLAKEKVDEDCRCGEAKRMCCAAEAAHCRTLEMLADSCYRLNLLAEACWALLVIHSRKTDYRRMTGDDCTWELRFPLRNRPLYPPQHLANLLNQAGLMTEQGLRAARLM